MKFVAASATILARPPRLKSLHRNSRVPSAPSAPNLARKFPASLVLLLISLAATLVHGYHPFAEDAGIYIAGIELHLHPQLFPVGREFISAHTALSIFAPFCAAIARALHLPLAYALFALQLATTWLLLFACWQIARRCFADNAAAWSAVALVAACLTVPVAGTSLSMMDPYLTGRSFSTPFILLAIAGCLRRRWLATLLPIAAAALFHPLMATYAAGFLFMLLAAQNRSWRAEAALAAAAIAAGAALQFSQRNVVETPAYVAAALTRTYFYLSQWQWYEVVGVLAPPLMLLAYALWWRHRPQSPAARARVALCWALVLYAAAAVLVSLLFVHPGSRSHLVARLQPLRAFHIIYLVFFLLLGGFIGRFFLKRVAWRWCVLYSAIAATMFFAQLATYPSSPHFEAPWLQSPNPWTQAFQWIRESTPQNALFALDANYITAPLEDAQGFRAEAQRSSLADYSKDGGASAIFPQLAPDWMAQHTADANLSSITDQQRLARLDPYGVAWIILQQSAQTAFPCPYDNGEIRVCQLPQRTAPQP